MAEESTVNKAGSATTASPGWEAKQVYVLALVCLVIGLAVGYLFRGSQSSATPPKAVQTAPQGMGGDTVTLGQMKHMADKQAEPLLAKLKEDPKNTDVLVQIGNIYMATHQFQEAAGYFRQSLEINPKNIPIRTQLASCLYYGGDVDGALQELIRATSDSPTDANSLFNLGMIRWQGKKDAKGAIEAWTNLLKTNPKLDSAKKAQVERLIANAREQRSSN